MKNYFSATLIFCLVIVVISCSQQEDNKSHTQPASRPSVPVQAGEVLIGNQIWMTKNLNVSRYRNGDPIPQVQDFTQWVNLTTGAWCYYQNNTANGRVYGKLYNWYAVNDPRGLAPQGWHIPTADEWLTLQESVGGQEGAIQSLWNFESIGNNSSGFTALRGGYREPEEQVGFDFQGLQSYYANWWSSSTSSSSSSWGPVLCYWLDSSDPSGLYNAQYNEGHYVRCIKD